MSELDPPQHLSKVGRKAWYTAHAGGADMTPRTAAGRAMFAKWGHPNFLEKWNTAILAIEAEASSSDELRAAASNVLVFADTAIADDGEVYWDTLEPAFTELLDALRAALHASRLDADKEGKG